MAHNPAQATYTNIYFMVLLYGNFQLSNQFIMRESLYLFTRKMKNICLCAAGPTLTCYEEKSKAREEKSRDRGTHKGKPPSPLSTT